MKEWNYSKNAINGLNPNNLVEGSNKRAWWTCATCGNNWEAMIQKRAVRKQGCPICGKSKQVQILARNRVANKGSLVEQFPSLMQEWHYEKNEANCPIHP